MSVDEAINSNKKETGENTSQTVQQSAVATTTGENTDLETRCRLLEEEVQALRESETTLKQQYADSQRRERILVRRLAGKEQEMQDYMLQISEYKAAQAPGSTALRNALLDPAVNILFQKLKQELQSTKAKLEETQNELSAWKFTPDSNTGKRLMAKCRLLYQENEELGKMTSNGRLAKLEADLAIHKGLCDEVKKSQSEMDDFLQEIDEDVEGMQSTILFLQQELKQVQGEKEHFKELYEQSNRQGTFDTDSSLVNGTNVEGEQNNETLTKTSNLNRTQNGTEEIRTCNKNYINGEETTQKTNKNNSNIEPLNTELQSTGTKRNSSEPSEIEIINPTKRTRRAAAIVAANEIAMESGKKMCSIDSDSNKKMNANGIVNVS